MFSGLRKYQLAGITKAFSGLGFLPDPDNEYRWVLKSSHKEGYRCYKRYRNWHSSAMSIIMTEVGCFNLYECKYRYHRRNNNFVLEENLLFKKLQEWQVIWEVKKRLKQLRTGGKKPDQFHMKKHLWKQLQQST